MNQKERDIPDDITYEAYPYENISERLRVICNNYHINGLKCEVYADKTINAYAFWDDEKYPHIGVTSGLIDSLLIYKNEIGVAPEDVLLVTLGHELGHIYHRDQYKNVKRQLCAAMIQLMSMFSLIFVCKLNNMYLDMLISVILIAEMGIGSIMSDRRYWSQIAELRADRFAVNEVHNGRNIFNAYWGSAERIGGERSRANQLNEQNIFYQYYKRYIENEAHPSIKRRCMLINRKKWYIWEYFEHAFVIIYWKINKKGWNGI